MKINKEAIHVILAFVFIFGGIFIWLYFVGEDNRKRTEELTAKCEKIGGVYFPGSALSPGNCVFPPQ